MRILASSIVQAMNVDPIHHFSSMDDEFIDRDDALLLAKEFYYDNDGHRPSSGRFTRLVSMGLLEIEKPVREGDSYIVCLIPTEFTQKAFKLASLGCDFYIHGDDLSDAYPDLQTAFLRMREGFQRCREKFEELAVLLPEKAEIIHEEFRAYLLRNLQGFAAMRGFTPSDRKEFDRIYAFAIERFPDYRDDFEDAKADLTMKLVGARRIDKRGVFHF